MKENFVNRQSTIDNRNYGLRFTIYDLRSQEGASLYLALVIMSIFLAMSLAIGTLLLRQLEQVRSLGNSVIAFYAADTGIERELFEGNSPPLSYSDYLDLNGNGQQDSEDAVYNVSVLAPGPNCLASNYCVKSVGLFQETKRAIEIRR